MKIKQGILIDPTFKNSCRHLMAISMPLKLSAKFAKVQRELAHLEAEIDDSRMLLIGKYGQRDEHKSLVIDGNNYVILPEKLEEYNKKYLKLLNKEVELQFEPVIIDDLGDASLTPKMLAPLLGVILV